MPAEKRIRVCYILSYYFPAYVRTHTLLSALRELPNVELYQAVNTTTNFLHYFETIYKVIAIRIKYNPDLYILGFRGYEFYWLIRLLTCKRPLLFDHMMSPYDSLLHEKQKIKPDSIPSRILYWYEQSILKNADIVLADTPLHRQFFIQQFRIPERKVCVVHVGTDEKLFKPIPIKLANTFTIFFYGSFLPLHGMPIILEAAKMVQELPIRFHLVGGHKLDLTWFHNTVQQNNLTNIDHTLWIPYKLLPNAIATAHLCLGGPLGNTGQAQRIITGKTYQFLRMAKPTVIGQVAHTYPFRDRDNCFYIPQGNANALTGTIRWAFTHRSQLPEIGQNGYRIYQDNFSKHKISLELETVIKNEILSASIPVS